MREPLSIPEEDLRACLREEYDLAAVTLEFLPLGLDTRAGLYRVVSERGTPYLLKVKAGSFYEAGARVPRYLADEGIAAVVAPQPTMGGALRTHLPGRENWVAMLYPFIEGDRGWNPAMTDEQWQATGAALRQIHQVALPPGGFASLRREAFDAAEYRRSAQAIEAELARVEGGSGSQIEQTLSAGWRQHQPAIHAMLAVLEGLAGPLRDGSEPYVICHADLHPSNIIRGPAGGVHIIDWDDVMLAPKERDFLFTGDPAPADGVAGDGPSPFFQGYGPDEIDWVAIAYYRYERIVQDVIVCAQEVLFRDDLGEETKAEQARLFDVVLTSGNMIEPARRAAAHLPAGLDSFGVPEP